MVCGTDSKHLRLYVVALLAAAVGLGVGPTLAKNRKDQPKKIDLRKKLEQLRSLPYATTSPDEETSGRAGISLYDTSSAYRGYNLYAPPDAGAVLMDMQGTIAHQWTCPLQDFEGFNCVTMLPGGDLLGLSENYGLVLLDWDSNLLLERRMDAHHDAARAQDGTYLVLSYETKKYRDLDFRFDTLVQLSSQFEPVRQWSTYRYLDQIKVTFDQRSFTDVLLDSMIAVGVSPSDPDEKIGKLGIRNMPSGVKAYDYFHLNTITLLPDTPLGRKDPRFRPGNILTCARNVNQIAVLDGRTFEILWVWGEGVLQWPHHPTMLENGNILVFDNGVLRKYSSVIEMNPASLAIEWQYVATPPESFHTSRNGSAQRLPNGNTFICEGMRGRAFEVTRDGEIVWEWLNPQRKDDHRLAIYRMIRLSPDAVEPLLGR